jgi:hypothetical protein
VARRWRRGATKAVALGQLSSLVSLGERWRKVVLVEGKRWELGIDKALVGPMRNACHAREAEERRA